MTVRYLLLGCIASILVFTRVYVSAQHTLRASTPVFVENRGQWDRQVKFLMSSNGLDVFVTKNGVVYDAWQANVPANEGVVSRTAVHMSFVGASNAATVAGVDRADGHHNYYLGNDKSRWFTNVPLYRSARIENLYYGIDAVFYLDQDRPRYDIVVSPGANASQVELEFSGAEKLHIDASGSLVISTRLGDIVQRELFAYQMKDGAREQVHCSFVRDDENTVRFELGAYDHSRPLVIDPLVIAYSTFFGGAGSETGSDLKIGPDGTLYLGGSTSSKDFPTLNPSQPVYAGGDYDSYVSKFKSDGTLMFSTYFGGSKLEYFGRITVDTRGNVWITGQTQSLNLPVSNAFQATYGGETDAYVAMFSTTGALRHASYLGGAKTEYGWDVGSDANENVYVTGFTASTNFPTINAAQPAFGGGPMDAFVNKIANTGALVYSTYHGGGVSANGGSGQDHGKGIAVKANGEAFVVGLTESSNFPVLLPMQAERGGGNDAFITVYSSDGVITFSTLFGASRQEVAHAITLDASDNIYVAGLTESPDFILKNATQTVFGGQSDVFLMKINASRTLEYSTYIGGEDHDFTAGIAVDGQGNVFTTGETYSKSFPTLNAYQPTFGGESRDAFLVQLNSTGALVYSSYFGGKGVDVGKGVAAVGDELFLTGGTNSENFPIVNAAKPTRTTSQSDAFIIKFGISGQVSVDEPPLSPLPTISVVPNPANEEIFFTSDFQLPSSFVIEIHNSGGVCVKSVEGGSGRGAGRQQERISTAELQPGAYSLRFLVGGRVHSKRFVVVR